MPPDAGNKHSFAFTKAKNKMKKVKTFSKKSLKTTMEKKNGVPII